MVNDSWFRSYQSKDYEVVKTGSYDMIWLRNDGIQPKLAKVMFSEFYTTPLVESLPTARDDREFLLHFEENRQKWQKKK